MNTEEYFALLEKTLDSYSHEETEKRLNSYCQEGPSIEDFLLYIEGEINSYVGESKTNSYEFSAKPSHELCFLDFDAIQNSYFDCANDDEFGCESTLELAA